MPTRAPRKPRPPLDQPALEELALAYVGRFATTRARLAAYLARKVRERGWAMAQGPDLAALAERHAAAGLVDDAAFAMSRARALGCRGFGRSRVRQQLRVAGVAEADGAEALDYAARNAVDSALRFAERRRIGPFATARADPRLRQRQVAAMVRAGHPLGLALAILKCAPGDEPDRDFLAEGILRY